MRVVVSTLALAITLIAVTTGTGNATSIEGLYQKRLSEAFPMLTRYLAAPETSRSSFRLRYCTQLIDQTQKPIRLRFKTAERDVTLSTDESGCFEQLPEQDDLRKNPIAVASAPEASFRMIVALEPAMQLSKAIPMQQLAQAVKQANAAARAAAGPMAWGAPHLDSIHFDFGTPQQATPVEPHTGIGSEALQTLAPDAPAPTPIGQAVLQDGQRVTLPWQDGRLVVKPEDPQLTSAEWIVFDITPNVARIGFSEPLKR